MKEKKTYGSLRNEDIERKGEERGTGMKRAKGIRQSNMISDKVNKCCKWQEYRIEALTEIKKRTMEKKYTYFPEVAFQLISGSYQSMSFALLFPGQLPLLTLERLPTVFSCGP